MLSRIQQAFRSKAFAIAKRGAHLKMSFGTWGVRHGNYVPIAPGRKIKP